MSGLRFPEVFRTHGDPDTIMSCHRDAKWIAGWFKQVNNSASKSKRQTGMVGPRRRLSRSQTAPAMAATPPPTQSIDGSNAIKSPSENLVEPTTSGNDSVTSPSTASVFSAPLEHTYLFSRSGLQAASEDGRSATTGYRSYRLHSGWELEVEYPAVVAPDLQANRELERPSFYLHSQHGANSNPVAHSRPHMDLVDPQLPLGVVTNSSAYLASQALPPFRHGTSSPNSGTGTDDVRSRNAHTSPAPASALPGPLQTPSRYVHMNIVSERPDPAYTELELGSHSHVDLSQSHSQSQAVAPDFVAATGSQLGPPSESSAPLPSPSMYWLLFDTELDTVVDRERDDVVSRSSSRGMMEPHVTPTPISFLAKWEDMLALERRIRSSVHNAKLVQSESKQIQAGHPVEPNRTRQQSGTGKGGLFPCPPPFSLSLFLCRELMYVKADRGRCGSGRDR